MSMRLGKGWGVWILEFRLDFNVVESGMDVFINWKKDFVGKEATQAVLEAGPKQRLVTLSLDVNGIDVSNDKVILLDGKAVGYVSSGGFGHRTGQSLAMGYVAADLAISNQELQVGILGQFYDARVLGGPSYDADGVNMRC